MRNDVKNKNFCGKLSFKRKFFPILFMVMGMMFYASQWGVGSFGLKTSLSGNDLQPSYVKKNIILQKSQEVILYTLASLKLPPAPVHAV